MELIKKNIHMDRADCRVESQFTLEEDSNISDSKPDVTRILLSDGEIKIDEIRPGERHVTIKGRLMFSVLYESEDSFARLFQITGKIPFEEQLNSDCISASDSVFVTADLEHLNITTINSRKLNVQSLLLLSAVKEEIYDEEISVGIDCDEPVEYRQLNQDFLSIAVMKKDIYRIREEISIPSNYPNILEVLWKNVTISDLEWKTLDDKISIKGQLNCFYLYSSQNDETEYQFFETAVPFSGVIDCPGCEDTQIPNITYFISQNESDIRPDLDGEERILGVEIVLDLCIRLYKEETLDYISDIYGVLSEMNGQTKDCGFKKLLSKNSAQIRLNETFAWPESAESLLWLKYSVGTLQPESAIAKESTIEVEGYLPITVLYVTDDDRFPYRSLNFQLPFSESIDIPGMTPACKYQLTADLEHLTVTPADSESLEIKATLSFNVFAYENNNISIISDVSQTPLDAQKLDSLPGIAVYFVKPQDTLWKIGKQYYVPVGRIKELNSLSSDNIKAGDKLLLMR